jgi:hypothetical protein
MFFPPRIMAPTLIERIDESIGYYNNLLNGNTPQANSDKI